MWLNIYQRRICCSKKSQNKQIVIQKSDKGYSIAIVDRDKYIERMENFLKGQITFQKIALKDDNFLNSITSQEKRIDKCIKSLLTLIACLKKYEDI